MEHHGGVLSHGMLINQRVGETLASDHPVLVPTGTCLLILDLVELLEGHEPRLSAGTNAVEMHGLVLEGLRLESTIDVPACSPNSDAAFLLIVGDSEDVRVRTLRVLVESALDCAKLLRHLHLSFAAQTALALEDQDAVLFHVLLYPLHNVCRKRLITVQGESPHLGAEVGQDGHARVRSAHTPEYLRGLQRGLARPEKQRPSESSHDSKLMASQRPERLRIASKRLT
mmetsp:Transcript_47549/g.111200  ORF Transcript_47549/g.111200 Transcript_47549/m.111200 type:complete len:228 (-) Transcript_47549:17-700(-)